jgi:hypothetical protein
MSRTDTAVRGISASQDRSIPPGSYTKDAFTAVGSGVIS